MSVVKEHEEPVIVNNHNISIKKKINFFSHKKTNVKILYIRKCITISQMFIFYLIDETVKFKFNTAYAFLELNKIAD